MAIGISKSSQQGAIRNTQSRPLIESAKLDIGASRFATDLKSVSPDLVIHCAGPFQGQDYRVAKAAIAAGAHYLDLADGREFVSQFSAALSEDAKAAGLFMTSGASTVPALSSAIVDELAQPMRTRFLSYNPPMQASAEMVRPSGLFAQWAASMRFRDREDGGSDLIYTYSIKLRPRWFGLLLGPVAGRLFAMETRRRFAAMSRYLIDRSDRG